MRLSEITPFVLTLDEEPNVGRVLERLAWADRVVVVDSHSTDRTVPIAKSFPNVELYSRGFDTFAGQSNFALEKIDTEWVLALDADYVVSDELLDEIDRLPESPPESGFFVPFRYRVLGRVLRASLYPPRQVLFRRAAVVFEDDGHGHRARVAGASGRLSSPIIHDDRKPLGRWLRNQGLYADAEAVKLARSAPGELGLVDRLRATAFLGPPVVGLYCLVGKGLILEGRAGWYYTLQRTLAETVLALKILEGGVEEE